LNIPQTYTDLVIRASLRSDRASNQDNVGLNINGSSANRTWRRLRGSGSAASSSNGTTNEIGFIDGNTATASTFGNLEILIPNYAGSTNKSISADSVDENNATAANQTMYASLWSQTAAITSLELVPLVGTEFVEFSTATLYGISKVPAIAKAYGGDITYDNSYVYHTFPYSGTFTPLQNLTVDYLVVAGGGGAAGYNAGGAGAGGLRSTVTATGGGGSLESALSLTSGTNYTVTVGAGGAGGNASTTSVGNNGSNSVFSTITSIGGGKTEQNQNGSSGGSGGGGYGATGTSKTGGAGTANQGYAGGNNFTSPNYSAGGGGGAGAVGGNGTSTTSGSGGNGVAVSITGTSVTYAGGGGGGYTVDTALRGLGGTGGGGDGGASGNPGSAGTANTGGGGGGGAHLQAGGNGGSGIVIVRYAK
jgi:hypothetical protein